MNIVMRIEVAKFSFGELLIKSTRLLQVILFGYYLTAEQFGNFEVLNLLFSGFSIVLLTGNWQFFFENRAKPSAFSAIIVSQFSIIVLYILVLGFYWLFNNSMPLFGVYLLGGLVYIFVFNDVLIFLRAEKTPSEFLKFTLLMATLETAIILLVLTAEPASYSKFLGYSIALLPVVIISTQFWRIESQLLCSTSEIFAYVRHVWFLWLAEVLSFLSSILTKLIVFSYSDLASFGVFAFAMSLLYAFKMFFDSIVKVIIQRDVIAGHNAIQRASVLLKSGLMILIGGSIFGASFYILDSFLGRIFYEETVYFVLIFLPARIVMCLSSICTLYLSTTHSKRKLYYGVVIGFVLYTLFFLANGYDRFGLIGLAIYDLGSQLIILFFYFSLVRKYVKND